MRAYCSLDHTMFFSQTKQQSHRLHIPLGLLRVRGGRTVVETTPWSSVRPSNKATDSTFSSAYWELGEGVPVVQYRSDLYGFTGFGLLDVNLRR